MKYYFLLLILSVVSIKSVAEESNIGKQVSESWINRVIEGDDKGLLVHEFGEKVPSQVISNNPSDNNEYSAYLSLTKINLDDDIDDEYILIIGTHHPKTMFYLVDNNHKIIYEEYLWLYNDYPQLTILNAANQHKLITLKYLYGRGSGYWLYTNKIYRMNSGKLNMVLEFVDESNDSFNSEGINGHITTDSVEEYGDDIHVRYSFELSPHPAVLEKLGIKNEQFTLIKKQHLSASYSYDSDQNKFIQKDQTITPAMEQYFLKPSNDGLFLKAFAADLAQLLTNGTAEQKKVIEYLINKKQHN